MIVSEQDVNWEEHQAHLFFSANQFIKYFSEMGSIEDYMRFVKKEIISGKNNLFSLKDQFFNSDIYPEEMQLKIVPVGGPVTGGKEQASQKIFTELLSSVSSHNNEQNVPGRELKWIVYEKNTNTILGFIRFGSPTINSKPRNIWLGNSPDLKIFNRHAVMGFVIVPSQPFGYNYLGGKLLALLCCSHFARETLNEKFKKNIALFETTSLYGSVTDSSQYDGLKPFIRYKGLTESKFLPLLHDDIFHDLHSKFTFLNNNTPLTDNKASSKKMKRQTKMISIIRNSLQNQEKLSEFNSVIGNAFELTQKKRFYTSEYGYQNVRQVLLGEEEKLVRGPNWDKFELENIISWWKKKATKRYEKLKQEGRFRTKVELWTEDDDIQIIR